jgi:hypothetical protein
MEPRWKYWAAWVGRAVSLWPVYVLVSSASWKLTRQAWYVAEWQRIGYSEDVLTTIGLIQVTCIVLYLIPQTALLGTVLLTGYLGGAIASYTRIGELDPVMVPLSTCLAAWAGIFLREQRLWRLLPLRLRRRS